MSGLTNLVEKTGLEKENYTKQRNKCVKLRKSSIKTSLLNYVSFVPTCFTCLRSYVSYVPTCLCTLNYDVSTCPHFLPGYVPTSLCAYKYIFCAFQSLWLKLFRAYVHSFFTCLNAYNHSQNILKFTSILGIGIFGILFHSKPQKKHLPLKLHTSILPCGVLLSELAHAQMQWFEDPVRNHLKQWILNSILNS